jgi:hypothetical protein
MRKVSQHIDEVSCFKRHTQSVKTLIVTLDGIVLSSSHILQLGTVHFGNIT